MPLRTRTPRATSRPIAARTVAALAAVLALSAPAWAQSPRTAPATPAPAAAPSAMDDEAFFLLLSAELELRRGETATAWQMVMDLARRYKEEALFRRAVDIAVRARWADQAVQAARAWRSTLPRSRSGAETHAQILMALGRAPEAAEPVKAMIDLTPAAERPEVIASLPRLVTRPEDAKAGAVMIDDVLRPHRDGRGATRPSALLASGRAWAGAGAPARALDLARQARDADPTADGPALLALDLMGERETAPAPAAAGSAATPTPAAGTVPLAEQAEALVRAHLEARPAAHAVRLPFARRLAAQKRYGEAAAQLERLTAADPSQAEAWLTLGALRIELGQGAAAREALERHVALQEKRMADARVEDDDESPAAADRAQRLQDATLRSLTQSWLMLAQVAEQQRDFPAAQRWLEKVAEHAQSAGESTSSLTLRRASLLSREGRTEEARALIAGLPGGTPEELRIRVMAETEVLREAKRWDEAWRVLEAAQARLPAEPDLLYEQSMIAEKLSRFDEMERLLREVMRLKPDHHHAYNALGYSLADRRIRLPEARELIAKALALAPGDPFITDSMGWAEYRLGNVQEAARLLREAWQRRPDTEIGAHLGEVLWVLGQQDDARRVWKEAQERDAANEVLQETLRRFKVRL
jgi:tetratricopeptide (TPR) repeat protein